MAIDQIEFQKAGARRRAVFAGVLLAEGVDERSGVAQLNHARGVIGKEADRIAEEVGRTIQPVKFTPPREGVNEIAAAQARLAAHYHRLEHAIEVLGPYAQDLHDTHERADARADQYEKEHPYVWEN